MENLIGDFIGDIRRPNKPMVEIMQEALERKKVQLKVNPELKKMLGGFREFIPKQPRINNIGRHIAEHAKVNTNPWLEMFNKSIITMPKPEIKPKPIIENIHHINLMEKDDIEFIFYEYKKNKCGSLKKLGYGNYGDVYEYKNYAIKVFKYSEERDSSYNSDYESLLKVQGIPLFNKLYCYLPRRFMVTEKINGLTLFQLKQENKISERINFLSKVNLIETIRKLQTYIQAANDRKLILTDLHDSNIMITEDNKIIVVDIGHCYESNYSVAGNSITMLNSDITALYNMNYLSMKPY